MIENVEMFLFLDRGWQEKGKGRKGTKSHASVIFHLFIGKPP